MTLVWFIVWLITDQIGDRTAIRFDPVNFWAGWLLLAVALDLGRQHAGGGRRRHAHHHHDHDHDHSHEH